MDEEYKTVCELMECTDYARLDWLEDNYERGKKVLKAGCSVHDLRWAIDKLIRAERKPILKRGEQ